MPKEISFYNLSDNVTDEQYQEYVKKFKGPLLESMPSVTKFELVRIKGAVVGEAPYNYVGILHVKNLDEFYQKGTTSQKFQDFMKELMPMVSDANITYGEEVY